MRKRWDGTKFVSLDGEPEAAPVKAAAPARPDAVRLTADNLDAHIRQRIDEALSQYTDTVREFVSHSIDAAIRGTAQNAERDARRQAQRELRTVAPMTGLPQLDESSGSEEPTEENTNPGKGQDTPK